MLKPFTPFILTLALLTLGIDANAQTFTNSTITAIPDVGPLVVIPITVSGLSPTTIDTVFGLETVCFDITHTYCSDLQIKLQSPDGSIVDLAIACGGGGDNFTGTCLNQSAATSVVIGNAPFTGVFRPQGYIGALNNGQTGNGVWNLLVQDVAAIDTGFVNSCSITFGNAPAHPFLFTSSNLPIVVINTGNQSIPDEPKLQVEMGIIDNGFGVRNYMTDTFNAYHNKIGIEMRGSSSQSFPQKSYGIETRDISGIPKDTILMGMPKEHDWILYAPYDDKTCIRDVLAYDIANQTGHYASRTRLCELVVDDQYQGIYVMMEKVKRDSNRVSVAKCPTTATSGDALTGGYIIKIDRDYGAGSYFTSNFLSNTGQNINLVYVYPKYTTILPIQKLYIQRYVDSFEVALDGPNFMDTTVGYRKYIGVNSFIDYFILTELSKNVDGYRLSTFLYKDKASNGGKLKAGPAWDYNLAFWNADYCNADLDTGWCYQQNNICGGGWQSPFWWDKLLLDPSYASQLQCRWLELRQSVLSVSRINNYCDSLATYLNEAQQRHFEIWPIIGTYTWPNPSPIPTSYAGEITAMKTWITNRIAWIDANLPGVCYAGISQHSFNANDCKIYPNPFTSQTNIVFTEYQKNTTIKIKDVLGKEIKLIIFTGKQLTIDRAGLQSGIYFMQITDENKNVVNKKIMIQ